MTEWNPRYIMYCRANGHHDPNKQLEDDAKKYPGGKMCGFILWISERVGEFCKEKGICREYLSLYGDKFDSWLEKFVKQEKVSEK